MRVAVTGASGFVGQHVVRALDTAGHEAWAARRARRFGGPNLETLLSGIDAVVHLAAYCGGIGKNRDNPAAMLSENMRLALRVVPACAEADVHLIALGSVCAYPEHTPIPFKEDYLWQGYPEPTNAPYGIAKRVLLEACKAFGGPYTYLLPANMYGPGDHFDLETSHVVPAMIRKFMEAGEGQVALWGDGTPTRDFLYVEDCAQAIVKAVEHGPHPDPINLGTGVETSIRDLASKIGYACGRSVFLPVTWDKSKPNGQPRRCLDTSRAKEVLGWEATTPLIVGLAKTVEWYRNQQR